MTEAFPTRDRLSHRIADARTRIAELDARASADEKKLGELYAADVRDEKAVARLRAAIDSAGRERKALELEIAELERRVLEAETEDARQLASVVVVEGAKLAREQQTAIVGLRKTLETLSVVLIEIFARRRRLNVAVELLRDLHALGAEGNVLDLADLPRRQLEEIATLAREWPPTTFEGEDRALLPAVHEAAARRARELAERLKAEPRRGLVTSNVPTTAEVNEQQRREIQERDKRNAELGPGRLHRIDVQKPLPRAS